jgi:ABC-type nitrate/sulfonate/bicarbonate transport system permease component
MTAVAAERTATAPRKTAARWPGSQARLHVLFAAIILVTWEITSFFVGDLILPSATSVAAALFEITISGVLPIALGESILLLFLGISAALIIGFFFGILIGRSRIAQWTLSPYFSALFVTPTVALVPLVLVWFGFGLSGRVLVVILAAVVPILLSVAGSLRDDPGELVEVAKSFGVHGEIPLLIHVRLRAALPVILSGLRLAVGRAVVGMAVAETYLRLGGIGALINSYGALFQTDFVFATILPLSLLGIVLTKLVGLVERHFQGWKS